MKSFAGLRGVTALEFAAGRDIFVWVDEDGLIYWADEIAGAARIEGTPRLLINNWRATA